MITTTYQSGGYNYYNSQMKTAVEDSATTALPTVTRNELKTECECGNCSKCSLATPAFDPEAAVFEKSQTAGQLDPDMAREIETLKKRDAEVRQHEQAHLLAAGPHAKGAPSYEYEIGPDGNRYASGGEVEIDTTPIPDDPEATVEKAKRIKAAALAPAEPSSQDYRVAAQAEQMELKARQELSEKLAKEPQEYNQYGSGVLSSAKPAIVDLML